MNENLNNINSSTLAIYQNSICDIYNFILDQLKDKSSIVDIKKNYFENLNIPPLISLIKQNISFLINSKIEEKTYQYINTILNLEQNIRYYIQQNFLKKTKIDMLENEITAYMEMEEEFEEMKEKLKYEDGEFLNNEKKENEILILRAENSILKKAIKNNENEIKEKN